MSSSLDKCPYCFSNIPKHLIIAIGMKVRIILLSNYHDFLNSDFVHLVTDCRGISLLSVAGKVLARVVLRRLLTHVVDTVMPESQSGFRRGRSTVE